MTRKVLRLIRKTADPTAGGGADMPGVLEAQKLLVDAIGPVPAGTYLKTIFPSVARKLGVTVRRVETIWQGTARRIDAFEFQQIQALAARKIPSSPELAHADRYDAVATSLEAVDPVGHGPDIARYRRLASALRSAAGDRPVAR